MKISVVKVVSSEHSERLERYPSINTNLPEKKIMDFIDGCKYVILCDSYLYVVSFQWYNLADTLPENWIDEKLHSNPKDYSLKLKSLLKFSK